MANETESAGQRIQSQLSSLAVLPLDTAETAPASLRTRYDIAIDAIKSYIIQKKLSPGDPLPNEATLCEELSVSRSSVREAVRKLEALHIVKVIHGKGIFVGDLSLEPLVETLSFRTIVNQDANLTKLRDVIQVRRILDLGVAQQVVDAMEGTPRPDLEKLVRHMEKQAKKHTTFLEQDIEFHSRLFDETHNEVLKQLAHSLWLVHMAVLPQLGLTVSENLGTAAASHNNMLQAAIAGDVDAYRDAVVEHYKPIEGILNSYLG